MQLGSARGRLTRTQEHVDLWLVLQPLICAKDDGRMPPRVGKVPGENIPSVHLILKTGFALTANGGVFDPVPAFLAQPSVSRGKRSSPPRLNVRNSLWPGRGRFLFDHGPKMLAKRQPDQLLFLVGRAAAPFCQQIMQLFLEAQRQWRSN